MKEYYKQTGVRRAIVDFVYSGSPNPIREGAFYNSKINGIQRHLPGVDEDSIMVIDSERVFSKAIRAGATAFYSSYWRYSNPSEASEEKGRDLVWSLKSEDGGLSAAKRATTLFLEALEDEGFSHPLVKYSGELGFDVLIPLEDVQTGSPEDLDFLSKVQEDLTSRFSDYVESESSFQVGDNGSELKLKGSLGTCLLTELRWRRGLLLAPMSLHPGSGLVSVPLQPGEVPEFSVVEASPERVNPREWPISQSSPIERSQAVLQHFSGDLPIQN